MPTIHFNCVTEAQDVKELSDVMAPAKKWMAVAVVTGVIALAAIVLIGIDPAHLFSQIAFGKAGVAIGVAIAGVATVALAHRKREHYLGNKQKTISIIHHFIELAQRIRTMRPGEAKKQLALRYLQEKHRLFAQGNPTGVYNMPKYDDLAHFLEPTMITHEQHALNQYKPVIDVDLFKGMCASSCLYVAREIQKGKTMQEATSELIGGTPYEAALKQIVIPNRTHFNTALFDALWKGSHEERPWEAEKHFDDYLRTIDSAGERRKTRKLFDTIDSFRKRGAGKDFLSYVKERMEIPEELSMTVEWFSHCLQTGAPRHATGKALQFQQYGKVGSTKPISPALLTRKMDKFQPGLYLIDLPTSSGNHHALLLQKTEKDFYLFDPNLSSFVGKSGQAMVEERRAFYLPDWETSQEECTITRL